MPRHRRLVITALAVLLGLLGLPAAGYANTPEHYVALGDSFASGPFIPVQRIDPLGCGRSTRNYPSLVAEALQVSTFTDISCAGAVTANMTTAQAVPLGSNPAQFTALRPDTDLVTVSIGGNDVGYTDILFTCARLSFRDPLGAPCKQDATAGGTDRYAERVLVTAPRVATVLREISQRSPNATVVLVGYLRILPPIGGCWPLVPISRGDVPYLDGVQQQLTAALAEQARSNGALFVDPYAASLGHDTCQAPGSKWVEGFVPTSLAGPAHPNASGMRAVADLTLSTLTDSLD